MEAGNQIMILNRKGIERKAGVPTACPKGNIGLVGKARRERGGHQNPPGIGGDPAGDFNGRIKERRYVKRHSWQGKPQDPTGVGVACGPELRYHSIQITRYIWSGEKRVVRTMCA
jgi:hypothetical protein